MRLLTENMDDEVWTWLQKNFSKQHIMKTCFSKLQKKQNQWMVRFQWLHLGTKTTLVTFLFLNLTIVKTRRK